MKDASCAGTGLRLVMLGYLLCTSYQAIASNSGIVLDNGAKVRANLSAEYGLEDNVALTSSNEIQSQFSTLHAKFSIDLAPNVTSHSLVFDSSLKRYFDSSPDNFSDFLLSYNNKIQFSKRNNSYVKVSLNRSHQKRGTGLDKYLVESVDEVIVFRDENIAISHEYGSQISTGLVGAEISFNTRSYESVESLTRFNNYDSVLARAWFDYKLESRTQLNFEANYFQNQYDILDANGLSRDSDIARFYVGSRWNEFGKTSGRAKLGYERRSFENASRQDFEGLAVDIGLSYALKSYSKLNLDLQRKTVEAGVLSDFRLLENLKLSWSHLWSDVLSSKIVYQFLQENERGGLQRNDEKQNIQIVVARKVSHLFTFSLQGNFLINRSNIDVFDFDNHSLFATLSFKL